MANNGYDRNRPKWEWGDGWMGKGITDKQRDYIQILIGKAAQRGVQIEVIRDVPTITRGTASGLIEELKRVANYGESPKYLKRDWLELVEMKS